MWSTALWWRAGLLCLTGPPGLLSAQALSTDTLTISGVSVAVRVDSDDGSADVEVDYRLRGGARRSAVSMRLFTFLSAVPAAVRATDGDGVALALDLDADAREGVISGRVALPLERGGEWTIRFFYQVVGAAGDGRFRVTLPVVLVDALPEGSPEDMFVMEVALPPAVSLWETFPALTSSATDPSPGVTRLSLPVIPSMIRLHGGRGSRPRLTLPLVVDLGVGLAIVLLSLAGLIWARRAATGPKQAEGRHA